MRAGGGGAGGGDEFLAEMSELGSTWVGGGGGGGSGRWGSGQWERERERERPATTGMYYSPPGTSYTIVERPSTAAAYPPRGTYLGSSTSASATRKRPISPEQVLRMFGPSGGGASHHNSTTKLTHAANHTARRSPASSPASTTHQVSYSSIRSPAAVSAAGAGSMGGGVSGGGYPLHELSTRTVTMVRDPPEGTHGFGICVKGGKDSGVGVYISRVEEGSVAERAGLRPGDSILEVNGTPFTGISHEEALKVSTMLKSCRKLSMTVRSPALPYGSGVGGAGGGGGPWLVRQTCSWMDRQGRPVSPPLEYARSAVVQPPPPPPPTTQRYHGGSHSRSASKDRSIRRVDLCIEPGQSLGLMIRGGIEYNLGIFITGVDKDSVADRAGLMVRRNSYLHTNCGNARFPDECLAARACECCHKTIPGTEFTQEVGDQILEVNSQSFLDVTHDEAVGQLKYHKRMSLVVRDVGKVPHSCTAYGDGSPGGPASSAARSARRWAAALQMVEEKARVLLARPEFASLCYYTDEYAARHMDVEAYVHVVMELLNTPEKYTLVTELREIIAVEDRGRFDELVYNRPDPLRGAAPQLNRSADHHDYRHSRRKGGLQLDTGNHHSMLMSSLHEISAPEDMVAVAAASDDDYRSPSEDSGLGLAVADRAASTRARPASAASMGGGAGWSSGGLVPRAASSDLALPNDHDLHHQDYASGSSEAECDGGGGGGTRRHSSPGGSRTGSHADLHAHDDFPDSTGYLGGLRNQLGGWTQRMKSWYWGRPLELAHKLSRSFDMKDEQGLLDGGVDGGGMRRHQSMQRLARVDSGGLEAGAVDPSGASNNVTLDVQGNLRVTVRKSKPILGIAIEGGANTKHPLPRIINIHEHGAAHVAGGLEVGQLILQVDGQRVDGLQHQEVARLIAEAFARPDRPDIEFTVVEAKKSNLEPKPTALIFLEA